MTPLDSQKEYQWLNHHKEKFKLNILKKVDNTNKAVIIIVKKSL